MNVINWKAWREVKGFLQSCVLDNHDGFVSSSPPGGQAIHLQPCVHPVLTTLDWNDFTKTDKKKNNVE